MKLSTGESEQIPILVLLEQFAGVWTEAPSLLRHVFLTSYETRKPMDNEAEEPKQKKKWYENEDEEKEMKERTENIQRQEKKKKKRRRRRLLRVNSEPSLGGKKG